MIVHWLIVTVALGLGLLAVPAGLVGYVARVTGDRQFVDPASVPAEAVAIVFGAAVYADGRLSPMLADRVDAATDLYKAGRVRKLLLTGDNGRRDYDEVSAMRRHAVTKGVPAADITLDHAGFSTYESCYRATAIFGVDRAVLVTQRYHLPRAVYTCQALGIEVVGLGTPDWGTYSRDLLLRYSLREGLATLNALVQLHLTRPLPTFLGPFEGIR